MTGFLYRVLHTLQTIRSLSSRSPLICTATYRISLCLPNAPVGPRSLNRCFDCHAVVSFLALLPPRLFSRPAISPPHTEVNETTRSRPSIGEDSPAVMGSLVLHKGEMLLGR